MERLVIKGRKQLFGSVKIESSKNAILPILSACVLSSGKVTLLDIPHFSDIENMLCILKSMGASVNWSGNIVTLDCSNLHTTVIPSEYGSKIRASVFLLGSLLSKYKSATTSMPGGCKIGKRPVDIHIDGFKALGIKVKEESETIYCDGRKFIGGNFTLRFASVGATENLIMCAVLAEEKTTVINNCAKEPEIVDLCNFINSMGGRVFGAGTSQITIYGVGKLYGTTYTPISDRIIAGTYLIATAMCGGRVELRNAKMQHNERLITILSNLGCEVCYNSDNIYLSSGSGLACKQINISTAPYPEFATDLQAQTMAMLANSGGEFTITENLFETRFNHIVELNKMGANICVNGNTATIYGKPNCYNGADVCGSDLRGGAALVLAGLVANGITKVSNVCYIDRGYDKIEEKLSLLGAEINREV